MLVEFRFKNFLSFKDEQVFSMVASSDRQFLESNTFDPGQLGKRRLLRSAVVYGANASGKTNLIKALRFVGQFVEASAIAKPGGGIPVTPFLLDDVCGHSPSEFELTFIHESVRFQYGFVVDRTRVYEEWLLAFPKKSPQRWYERTWNPDANEPDIDFGALLKGEREKLRDLTRPDALFLSVGAQFNHPQLTSVHRWFASCLRSIVDDRGALSFMSARMAAANDTARREIVGFLRSFDTGIEDVSAEDSRLKDADLASLVQTVPTEFLQMRSMSGGKPRKLEVNVRHKMTGNAPGMVTFPLAVESSGTRRLFALGIPWLGSLKDGCLLAIDELDSSLHPLLVRGLVQMFHDPKANTSNAQLVFNTHDTTLLDTGLFRRDQIWFVEKDNDGASHLYSLLDFSPRKTEALGRGYLMGRYGAIPVMGDLTFLEEASCSGED